MSFTNWRGTSGWGAIDDPTGTLTGQVLAATAGATSSAEDYVQTEVGTSNSWTKQHYSVETSYAFFGGGAAHPMQNGAFGLIARAGNFTGSPADARDCYHADIDIQNGIAKICRRNSDVTTVLVTSALQADTYTRATRHTMRFDCFAGVTSAVRLALAVDGVTIANVGDSAANRLTSGEPGLRVFGGTVYVDDFTVSEFTESGAAPTEWLPTNLTNLAGWWKADTGLTVSGSSISAWADQSSNSNDYSQANATNQPQQLLTTLNSLAVVDFSNSGNAILSMSAADSASLDLNATGVSIFVVAKPPHGTATGTLINKPDSGQNQQSYKLSLVQSGSDRVLEFTGASATTDTIVASTLAHSIFGLVSDRSNAGTGLFAVNGTVGATFANINVGSDTSDALTIGSAAGGSTEKFDGEIAEVVIAGQEVSVADRQRIEGYLANKWGLQIFLPSDHPFRDRAPTV